MHFAIEIMHYIYELSLQGLHNTDIGNKCGADYNIKFPEIIMPNEFPGSQGGILPKSLIVHSAEHSAANRC